MMTLTQLMERFSDEDSCKTYLTAMRWPEKVNCPRCDGQEKIYVLKSRPFHWVCKNTDCGGKNGYRFSVISGTIFEDTKYPLRTWFQVLYLMLQSKKGMSALQIQRTIGCKSYETAWYMCHRLRAAMQNGEFLKLTGEVEVDETYVGGKNKNRHTDKKQKGRGPSGKVAVVGAIARKGSVVAQVVEHVDQKTLNSFVQETISDKVDLVATDEHSGYDKLRKQGFPHETVNHSEGEYVRGNVHTSHIDGFWSLIKRGIIGSFHHVSKDYLPLYVNEFAFRHNYRKDPEIFDQVISSC